MPLGPQIDTYRFPRIGTGFRGILDAEGTTEESFQLGYLWELYNYHLIGRGRLLKRQGHQAILAETINGVAGIQGMVFYNLGTTDYLLIVAGGKLKHYNGSAYTDITGALSLATGDNNLVRFAQFQQGSVAHVIGTGPNSGALWYWNGSGNAATLASLSTDDGTKPPSRAVDITEWNGRLWAINTDLSPAAVEFSDDGVIESWNAANYIYPARSSKGMGLVRHGGGTGILLVFYEDSIYRIESSVAQLGVETELFAVNTVDGNIGAASTYSILNSQGITYFASERGIYRIKSGRGPAEYISYPIQEFWKRLNQARIQYIVAFELGGPGNEVGFLASTDTQTQHNVALIWNPQQEGWSIFRSEAGYLKFSCGCRYINSLGQKITMLGRYDGKVSEAWGDNNHSTSYLDDAASAVMTRISTGMLDLGWDGLKRLKKIWLEIQLNANVSFQVECEIMGGVITNITPFSLLAGASGDKLSIDFIFDTSVLGANDTPEQIPVRKFIKGRKFRLTLTESAETQPHTLNSMIFLFKRLGRKLSAYA